MTVLRMVMSLIIGYVDRMCQPFLSGCVFSLHFFLFSTILFDLIIVDFDLSLPVRDKFFSQMMAEPSVSNWARYRIFKRSFHYIYL